MYNFYMVIFLSWLKELTGRHKGDNLFTAILIKMAKFHGITLTSNPSGIESFQ